MGRRSRGSQKSVSSPLAVPSVRVLENFWRPGLLWACTFSPPGRQSGSRARGPHMSRPSAKPRHSANVVKMPVRDHLHAARACRGLPYPMAINCPINTLLLPLTLRLTLPATGSGTLAPPWSPRDPPQTAPRNVPTPATPRASPLRHRPGCATRRFQPRATA